MSGKSSAPTRRRAYVKYSKRPAYRKNLFGKYESPVEMLVIQCIVCGIMLSALMLICIVKTPATLALREGIRLALGGNIDSQESVGSMAGVASNISSLFKNILIGEKADLAEVEIPVEEEAIPVYFNREKDFRIDEEIIESIYNGEGLEYYGGIKNIEAPQD